MSLQPLLKIKAESIIMHPAAYGHVLTMTLFRPDEATMERLKSFERGTMFEGVEVIDMRDDGEEDTHVNPRIHTLLQLHAPEPHKQHTQMVTFTRG